jgi:oxygen-independent coproporphyrinogen-3 oxidase
MTILIINHDFKYEVECLTRLFFPCQTIRIEHNIIFVEGDFIKTEILNSEILVEVKIGEEKLSTSDKILDDDIEFEIERKMGVCLYKLLSKLTKISPKWGILTGIRPVKLIGKYRAEGMSKSEISEFLHKDFLVDEQKINLSLMTYGIEQKILNLCSENSFSLYVSIPFCPTRCSYCSFVSHAVNSKKSAALIPNYIENLCEEIKISGQIAKELGLKLETVYFGGGTPTSLSHEQLKILFDCVKENFDLSKIREYTVEAGRADTITREKLIEIKNSGATRISINPQTLNDSVLKKIGRNHLAKAFFEAFRLARELGFNNINTDLIAGLPDDTFDSFVNTLSRIIELNPENITVHALSIKRSSDLYNSNIDLLENETSKMISYSQNALIENEFFPYYLYRQKNTLENLENVGFSKRGYEGLYNVYIMDESHTILAVGASAVTKLVNQKTSRIERIFNFKFHYEYIDRFNEILDKKSEIIRFYNNS